MPRPASKKSSTTKDSSANLGFEAKLWLSADKLPRIEEIEAEFAGETLPEDESHE